MVIGLGGALGPLIAGLLVPLIDWPAVFWFRAPLALSAFVLAWLLPPDTRPAHARKIRCSRRRAAGAGDQRDAAGTQPVAAYRADRRGWFIASALACVLAAAASSCRRRAPQRPIIDLRYFRDFDFSLLNAGHAALSLAGFSVLLLVPFYLSRFGGLTAHTHGSAAGLLACRHRRGGAARRAAGGTYTRHGCSR